MEIIYEASFNRCVAISNITVQANSKLIRIEKLAFSQSRSFKSIALPGIFLINASCLDFCLYFKKCFLNISESALRKSRIFLLDERGVRKPTMPPNRITPFIDSQAEKGRSLLRCWTTWGC
jgi:hypothetical protein